MTARAVAAEMLAAAREAGADRQGRAVAEVLDRRVRDCALPAGQVPEVAWVLVQAAAAIVQEWTWQYTQSITTEVGVFRSLRQQEEEDAVVQLAQDAVAASVRAAVAGDTVRARELLEQEPAGAVWEVLVAVAMTHRLVTAARRQAVPLPPWVQQS